MTPTSIETFPSFYDRADIAPNQDVAATGPDVGATRHDEDDLTLRGLAADSDVVADMAHRDTVATDRKDSGSDAPSPQIDAPTAPTIADAHAELEPQSDDLTQTGAGTAAISVYQGELANSLVFTDTLTAADDLNGIAPGRVVTTTIDGRSFAIVSPDLAYGSANGLTIAEVQAKGKLALVDIVGSTTDPIKGHHFNAQGMTVLEQGDKSLIYMVGEGSGTSSTLFRSISVLEMDGTGSVKVIQQIPKSDAYSGSVSQNGVDPVIVSTQGNNFLVQASGYGDALAVYKVKSDGKLAIKDELTGLSSVSDGLDSVTIDGKGFVVTTGNYATDQLLVHKVSGKGVIKTVANVSPLEPLIYNDILNDIKIETVGERVFVFVSENTQGSITVFEMSAKGGLTLVGHETADYGDGWGYPYSLETFEVDGQTYLTAAGVGSSIGVFAVSKNGALTEVDEWTFEAGGLRLVNELAVTEVNGQDFVLATSPVDNSLRSFRVDAFEDALKGNKKANKIIGTEEDDRIFGKAGDDTLKGAEGGDLIEGGGGKDKIFGGDGADDLYGGNENDKIKGEDGNDFIYGGDGKDKIFGGMGNDFIKGEDGKDTIDGEDGNDRIFGGSGSDALTGGAGNDELHDGKSADTLTGGSGSDMFIFTAGDGALETITDFEDGLDKIDLTAEGNGLSFPDLVITQSGNDLLVEYGAESILVQSINGALSVSDLGLDDFVFAV